MNRAPLRVIKLGGSLLDLASVAADISAWLAAQSRAHNVVLAGGGQLARAVRQWDQRFDLDPEMAHWLCVDAMSLTARLLARLIPSARLLRQLVELQTAVHADQPTACLVFDAADFLRRDEPGWPGIPLPRDWTATSDSIAARLAGLLGAAELVLLKSADPPVNCTAADWSESGYVDRHFPEATRGLARVRAVNLRSDGWTAASAVLG